MSVSTDAFRQALARFASGITVVTARRSDDTPLGVTVSAFSSVSLNPPLILVCLDKNTQHLKSYTDNKYFNINILSENQAHISDRFATPDISLKFDEIAHIDGENGAPLLANALVTLECAHFDSHPAGDHTILIGEVLKASWNEEGKPLLYWRGRYRSLASYGSS